MKLVLSCEHAGNKIPKNFENYFQDCQILYSHSAIDLGALDLFKTLKKLADFSEYNEISRLVIEANRSLQHKKLFSGFLDNASRLEKSLLIKGIYLPYRLKIENEIANYIGMGEEVLHLSVHSFTPVLKGVKRNADIGLLYDPARKGEKGFCKEFKNYILKENPHLKVRFNYPYLGKADGFTTFLRKKFPSNYLGVELEVNQKFSTENLMETQLKKWIFNALQNMLHKKPDDL